MAFGSYMPSRFAPGSDRVATMRRQFQPQRSFQYRPEFAQRGVEQGLSHVLGQLTTAAPQTQDFTGQLKTVGGEPANFTDIPQSAYLSPQALSEMQNQVFAQGDARTGAAQEQIRQQATPGSTTRFGLAEMLAGPQRFNDALAQQQSTQLAGEYAPTINRLAATAQTNVEAQRAGDDRDRRALTLARMRDMLQQEGGLLAALASFTQPLSESRGEVSPLSYGPFGNRRMRGIG